MPLHWGVNVLTVSLHLSIQALHARGWSRRRIARELGVHRKTVAGYIAEPKLPISTTGSYPGLESKGLRPRVRLTLTGAPALQVTQRPTFVLENSIGDKAVFSGVIRAEPLVAAMDAMLTDAAAYAAYRESFGVPPP
jgi:hypothetical protein